MADAVTVVARIRAAKGKGDALAALLTEQSAVVRKSELGCIAYRLHRAADDPDLFLFYETYVDAAAFDVHRKGSAPCRVSQASRGQRLDRGYGRSDRFPPDHRMIFA